MTELTGRLEAIWLKRAHRGKMDPVPQAELIAGIGLAKSVDRSRRRQVSLLERAVWERVTGALGASLDHEACVADAKDAAPRSYERHAAYQQIGSPCNGVGGELTPCEWMDEALPGLQAALAPQWAGGAFAQVLAGGMIRVGDAVAWEPA